MNDGDQPFSGEIEMSGQGVDFFVGYGIDNAGMLTLTRYVVFQSLRTIPNNTHASFQCTLPENAYPILLIDGLPRKDRAVSFFFNGALTVESRDRDLILKHVFFTASKERAVFERLHIYNTGSRHT